MEKRLEPKWVALLGGDEWIESTKKTDEQWLAALRCLDRSGNTSLLVRLLRSKIEMPRWLEMSPTTRELVADLLECYHLKKKGRRTTLFTASAPDRYEEAAETVRSVASGQTTTIDDEQLKLLPRELRSLFDRDSELSIEEVEKVIAALRVVQKTMSLTDRIDAVARVHHLDPGTLERHIRNKVGWGRGKNKKRPSGKKTVAAK